MTEQYGGFFMLRKLSAFILLSTSVGAVAYAQQTAESHPFPERAIQRFFYSASENGSYLGVQTQEVTKENFSRFGLRQVRGVAVEKVLENSPAAQAGLQPNDVIVRFNGEEVTGTRKLTRLISEVAPDHQARLTILRGGNEREITVTIGKRELPKMQTASGTLRDLESLQDIPDIPNLPGVITPSAPARPGEPQVFVFPGQASRQIGVGVLPLTKQLGEYFGAAEGQGLLINNVRENSPAAKAGLKAGDVIVQIDGKDVKGNLDLIRTLNEKKDGDVSLTIIRDRNRQTIRVTPESVKSETLNFENYFDKIGENTLPLKLRVKPPTAPVAPAPPVFFAPDVL
jgi:serine protease Do